MDVLCCVLFSATLETWWFNRADSVKKDPQDLILKQQKT